MKGIKKIIVIGGQSFYFPFTKDIREWLNIKEDNTDVEWEDGIEEDGKHCIIIRECDNNKDVELNNEM